MLKIGKRKVFALALAIAMLAGIIAVAPSTALAAGTTYYVDSVNGNDSSNGTGTGTAWKTLSKVNGTTFAAGDRILFKAGCSWSGELHPLGSGTAGSPICIDMYGTGNKPVISGSGAAASCAVHLVNQQYWEISNLEITNNASSSGNRQGVLIEATNTSGVINHIYLKNLNVHDVKGDLTFSDEGKATGGIISVNPNGARYNDFLVEGCYVKNTDRSGIVVCQAGGTAKSTNVTVRNNTVESAGGDAIICYVSESPLVEYNISINANARAYNYTDGYACAIWPWGCSNAVFQYNEAYGTKPTPEGDDGTAWDCDGENRGTVYQYNYSHDNGGGFMLVWGGSGDDDFRAYDSIVRYNISQNDKLRIFYFCGDSSNTTIYNNTFYVKSGMNTKMFQCESSSSGAWYNGLYAYNNIFYNQGSGGYTFGSGTNRIFDYNVFYGNHPSGEPSDAHKLTSDPLLANAGSGGTGINSVAGYMTQSGSPCINSGKAITGNGGKDYWGTAVPQGTAADRGACEYSGAVTVPAVPTGLQASAAGTSQINVSWNNVSDATGYDLLIDGTTVSDKANPYAHTGLAAGSTHSYQVRAKNSAGTSAWSTTVTATTQTASVNLIQNPGFESGAASWEDWGNSVVVANNAYSGTSSLRTGTGDGGRGQIISGTAGNSYSFSVWGKVSRSGVTGYIGVDCLDANENILQKYELTFTGTAYTKKSASFTAPQETVNLQIYVWKEGSEGNGYIYADDFSLN